MSKWLEGYDERQRLVIEACRDYLAKYTAAGLPGHNLMIIVGMMAGQLDRLVDTPLTPDAPVPVAQQPPAQLATEKQVKMIYGVCKNDYGMSDQETVDYCVESYKVGPAYLTKSQASEVIDRLKKGVQEVKS
jgi:hypothetical protein